jgi:hypothetical protein
MVRFRSTISRTRVCSQLPASSWRPFLVFASVPFFLVTPSISSCQGFHLVSILKPVYRSSPVLFHLSYHLFRPVFEFVPVLARTCSTPIRVAPCRLKNTICLLLSIAHMFTLDIFSWV